MQTRFKATRESVFSTADELLSEGLKPTIKSIRDRLDGGSQSSIHKYLSEWKKFKNLADNIHVKKQSEKIADLLKIIDNEKKLNLELKNKISEINAELTEKEQKIMYLTTINNAYSKSTDTALEFFNQKMSEMQKNFEDAVSILGSQVERVVDSSWSEMQKISHSYQDKLVDTKLQLIEQDYLNKKIKR